MTLMESPHDMRLFAMWGGRCLPGIHAGGLLFVWARESRFRLNPGFGEGYPRGRARNIRGNDQAICSEVTMIAGKPAVFWLTLPNKGQIPPGRTHGVQLGSFDGLHSASHRPFGT